MGGFWKSGTGVFDAEAAVSSVGFEIRWEGIQLHSWDIWFLNNGTGRNKVVMKDFNKCLRKLQRLWIWFNGRLLMSTSVKCTSNGNAKVQCLVFESDAGDFDAEATVSSASFEFEMQWEGIQPHSLNILLTVEQVETIISFIIMYMMSVQSNMV